MDRIVSKIKSYLDENGISARSAEMAIGVGNGTLSKPLLKGTSIKTDTLEKFLNTYKDFKITSDYVDEFRREEVFNDDSTPFNEKIEETNSYNNLDDTYKLNLLKEILGFDNSKLDRMLSNQERILELLDRQFIQENIKRIKEEIIKETTQKK